jgi:hypothetical protein
MGLLIMVVVLAMPRGLIPFAAGRWRILSQMLGRRAA